MLKNERGFTLIEAIVMLVCTVGLVAMAGSWCAASSAAQSQFDERCASRAGQGRRLTTMNFTTSRATCGGSIVADAAHHWDRPKDDNEHLDNLADDANKGHKRRWLLPRPDNDPNLRRSRYV